MAKKIADKWPIMQGDYVIGNPKSNVCIVTMSSKLEFPKDTFAICGELRTENLGIEKIVVNTISNSNIRYIVVCGAESRGHNAGQTLIALHKNSIDKNNRIAGSLGVMPYMENVPRGAVTRFQRQIRDVIDIINETDTKRVLGVVKSLAKEEPYREAPYIIRELKRVHESKMRIPEKDVIVSEDICFDPMDFIIDVM